MKKGLITFTMLLLSAICLAQDLDSLNQNKYWVYRDRFQKFFTHIGGVKAGESLPMDVIRRNVLCGDINGDRIEAGDVMAAMGEYLSVLATEYYLLKQTDDYEKLEACKNELFYAIRAIDEVDKFAEPFFQSGANDTKGFFVRDNIPVDYYQYWEETDNMAYHGAHATSGFIPDSIIITGANPINYPFSTNPWLQANKTFSMKKTDEPAYQGEPYFGLLAYKDCPDVRDLAKTQTLPDLMTSNEMSQDHMLGIMLGLKFIQKFVDDDSLFIRPTAQDSGMWVMAETRLIAARLMEHLSMNTLVNESFDLPNLVKNDNGTTDTAGYTHIKFKHANYIVMNPVTGLPVRRGWEAFGMSHGYNLLGEDLTGKDYPPASIEVSVVSQVDDPSGNNALSNFLFNRVEDLLKLNEELDSSVWEALWNKLPVLASKTFDDSVALNALGFLSNNFIYFSNGLSVGVNPLGMLEASIRDIGSRDIFDDINVQMVLRLGAVTGAWTHQQFFDMADRRGFPWFELMYASINDKNPILPKSYYDSLLDLAHCSGTSKWDLEIDHIDSTLDSNGGILSIDTTWYQPYAPFNKSSVFSLPNRAYTTTAWIKGDFNGLDYMWLHNMYRIAFKDSMESSISAQGCPCESTVAENYVNSFVGGLKDTLGSLWRFPEYRDIGIRIPEYITHDVNLYISGGKGGHIRPGGDLTICGAHVKLFQTSSIQMVGSNKDRRRELRIGNGGILELNSNSSLIVDTFSRIVVEPGGILRIRSGSKIVLDRGATLEIMGTLELMENAIFSITPGAYGQGYVRFKNNGPNSAAAQAKIIAATNTQFKLSGPYEGYKILEIDGSHPIIFPENMVDSITYGAIELGGGSSMQINGPIYVSDMDVEAKDTNHFYSVGFLTLGQEDVVIKKTDFSHGWVGIQCLNYINENTPVISEIDMDHMDVGLYTQGMSFNIQGKFDDCAEAIYVVKPSIPGKIHNTRVENGDIGIVYDAQSTGSLRLRYGTIKDNQAFGLYGMNGTILLECSSFDGNDDGLYLEHNPLVSINENQQAGGSLFKNNTSYVIHEGVGGFQLDLSNGNSSFTNFTDLFKGHLKSHTGLVAPLPPSTIYKLSSSYNYWDDTIAPYQYDLKYYIGNQGKLNSATVNLDHTDMIIDVDSIALRQGDLCPSYGTGEGQFTTKGVGSRNIDQDNQLITNTYYMGFKLSEVFENVNDEMYYQENFYTAYQRTKSIMDYSLSSLSKFDQYVVGRLYRTMMEAYGQVLYDTSGVDKAGMTTELIGTLEDLETKAASPSDSFWSSQNLQITMDLAEVYRMNNKRDTALIVLNDKRITLTEIDDLDNIDIFICVIGAEIDVLDGTTAPSDNEAYACYTTPSGSVPNYAPPITTDENTDKPTVDWQPQPNPAETGVEVVFNLKSKRFVEIEVYDILGHKLVSKERSRYKKGKNSVYFDVHDWPTGMYFVKFNYDEYTDSKRLIIQRN